MTNIDFFTPGKTFFYGAVAGGGVTYLIMSKVPAFVEKTTEKIGENIARRLKEGSRTSLNPGCGEFDTLALYNRLITTLDRIDSRLDRLETAYKG